MSLSQAAGTRAVQNFKSETKSSDKAKIEKSAQDFESVLIGQWLEQAEKSFATVPGGDPDNQTDPGHDQFQGIAMQSLAQHLTKAGGLGIAHMISQSLEKTQEKNDQLNGATKNMPSLRTGIGK
jgi:Rod binding domain-containing protein